MDRRLEDRIRNLCGKLLAPRDEEQVRKFSIELRSAVRAYIQRLREQYATYPVLKAHRRKNDPIPTETPTADMIAPTPIPNAQTTQKAELQASAPNESSVEPPEMKAS